MHNSNSSGKRKFDNTVPGGRDVDIAKLDQRRLDDFRERIKREEERREQNRSSGQSSGRSYSHN